VGAVGSSTSLGTVAAAASTVGLAAADGKFDFDTPVNRLGTDSVKWDQAKRQNNMDTIIAGMGIADMDFNTAPAITKALQERMKHEVWGYLDMPKDFVEGIVSWNNKRYGIKVDPELTVITTGVHPGIIATLRAYTPPGTKVLLTTPTYNGFYGDLRYTGTKPEESLMKVVDGRFQIDFDDFEKRISLDTNAFILCNPQNPTGNTWSPDDLMRIGEICLRHRVLVIADEIHCDFVTKGNKYTPFSTLPNKKVVDNSVTYKAASKSFGLAAMKCAWLFSTNAEHIKRIKEMNRADLTTLGMIASKAAYSGGEEWLNQCVDYIDGNHDFATKFITANVPLVKTYKKAQGTYLMWLDLTELGNRIGAKETAASSSKSRGGNTMTAEEVTVAWLAKNAKIALNAGNTYGLGGANHARMNIATSRKTLEAALTSMARACDGLKKTSTAAL
jgi:cystathionine beta-lyase